MRGGEMCIQIHELAPVGHLALFKYGGTYLDLDVVVLKTNDRHHGAELRRAESARWVAARVMNVVVLLIRGKIFGIGAEK